MELHSGAGEKNQIAQDLHAHGNSKPGDREVREGHQKRTHQKPDQEGVDKGKRQRVKVAVVLGAVAAPACPLEEQGLQGIHGGRVYEGVGAQVVAELHARFLDHLVDEHVVVATGKVHQIPETAHLEEQVLLVGEACGTGQHRVAQAESRGLDGGVGQGLEPLVLMHGAPTAGVPLWPLHDGDVPFEPTRHGGKPALGRHAVGVHNQQDFAAGFLESRFQGPLLGALYLGEVRVQMDGAEFVPVGRDEIVQDFSSGIGRAVVNADDLVLPRIFLGG